MLEASTAPASSSRAASASRAATPKKSAAPARAAKKKTVAKPATQAAAKPAAKPSKPAAKPAVKTKKPSAKSAPKAAAKPVAVTPAPQAAGGHNGSSKHKLVRDSFTMPSNDFGLIHTLKERAIGFRRPAKKSELLRAGLHALAALNDAKLKSVLDALAPLKSGRPKKAG